MSDTSVVFSILATEKVSDTLSKIPGAALLSGAAIGAALMGGISKAIDQESAANMLAAQIGGTPEMAASFGRIAGNLYSQNFGESIADIDEALKGVWQNGLVPEDASDAQLQAVTAKVINSAKLMGASYDEVSRTVSTMLRTGMAKSADEAIDILVRGLQEGVNKSDDLLDTFTEYPTQFRKLGADGTQAMGLLSQAIRAGARDSDTAADALKEFSIRAVDGSKSTADGFKRLGLDAKKMADDIAAGGPRANAALDATLDRLRAVKDPVQQSQIAVELFGTKAEDLGKALFAMDPSTAVQGLGDVAGAADRAGDALSKGAGAQIETFKRKLEQGFVQIVGGKVIPVLDNFGHTLQSIGDWGQRNWAWLGPVLVFLGTFAGVIATIVVAYKIWTAVTAAYTAVQAILNAVMMANPIGLIIIAIIALVAAFVYLWTHSEAFRNFWINLWGAIWGFLKAVGAWFAGPFAGFFVDAWHVIAGGAMWLWHNVLEPVWNGIQAAVGLAARIITSYVNLVAYGFKVTVGAAALWLWHNAIEPTAQGIAAVAGWLWSNVLSPTFTAIGAGAAAVGAAALWLWHNAIEPAFRGVAAVASWLWSNAISPTFDAIRGMFGKVGGWIADAFSGAAGIVRGAMNGVIGAINIAINGINWVIRKANEIPGVNFPTLPNIPRLDVGGDVLRSGLAIIHSGERVVPAAQVRALPPGGGGRGGGAITFRFAGNTDSAFATAFMQLVRAGLIQIETT